MTCHRPYSASRLWALVTLSWVCDRGFGAQSLVLLTFWTGDRDLARQAAVDDRGAGVIGAAQGVAAEPVLTVSAPLSQRRRRAAMAHSGHGNHEGLPAGRSTPGEPSRTWGGGRPCAAGRARGQFDIDNPFEFPRFGLMLRLIRHGNFDLGSSFRPAPPRRARALDQCNRQAFRGHLVDRGKLISDANIPNSVHKRHENGSRRILREPFHLVAGTGFEPATSGL